MAVIMRVLPWFSLPEPAFLPAFLFIERSAMCTISIYSHIRDNASLQSKSVISGLCKNSVLRRHVCIVFKSIRMSELINCSRYGYTVKPKHCYWLFGRENSTHVTTKNYIFA